MPPAAQSLPRTLVDRYELLRVLGEGSQGTVYEGRHLLTHRAVAVKTLRSRAMRSANTEARFLQEARIAAGIRHPNLIEVLDMGRDPADGTLFIVQPLLVGCSLEEILERERVLAPHTALEFLVPILGATARLHQEGVVHRDIKPANIFITRTREFGLVPVLIDLGVSKMPEGPWKGAVTEEGAIVGTPLYMAPEQLMGERSEDPQTDVWSCGALLYQCLCGGLPYEATSIVGLLRLIRQGAPPPLHTRSRAVSAELSAVVQQALEPDRAQRFPNMQALLGALLSCPAIEPRFTGEMLARRHPHATAFTSIVVHDTLEDEKKPPAAGEGIPSTARDREAEEWVPARIAALVPESNVEGDAPAEAVASGPSGNAIAAAKATRFTAHGPTVIGVTAPASRRRWVPWLVGGVIASLLAALGIDTLLASGPDPTTTPPSFEVDLRATPPSATLRIDGQTTAIGALRVSLPRDGRTHRVEVSAPGHYAQTVMFRDAPPPRAVVLQPAGR